MFDKADMDEADLDEFIGSLTFDQLGKLGAFFDDAPKLATDVQFKCNTCGKEQTKHLTGLQNFFNSFSHESVYNYFSTNFQLMQHHKYSLTELDNMMPWEREIYINLLLQHLEEEKEKEKETKKT